MDLIQGLETVQAKTKKHRTGYAIYTKICHKCGTKVDHLHNKGLVRDKGDHCSCGSNKFTVIEAMAPGKTEAIINSTLRYKCTKCSKEYDQPVKCCLANYEVKGKEMAFGYYCTGCTSIYPEKTKCCTAHPMYEGYYKPMSYEEYLVMPKFDTILPEWN